MNCMRQLLLHCETNAVLDTWLLDTGTTLLSQTLRVGASATCSAHLCSFLVVLMMWQCRVVGSAMTTLTHSTPQQQR